MNNLLSILLSLLGLRGDTSTTQKVSGVANLVIGTPAVVYLLAHFNDEIDFRTTYGFLALVIAVLLVVIEVQRRN